MHHGHSGHLVQCNAQCISFASSLEVAQKGPCGWPLGDDGGEVDSPTIPLGHKLSIKSPATSYGWLILY
jgi:hypothetical protein